jgi:MarR family transcriptional regulator, organic hydroperoxide resistance regulator
MEFWDFIPQYHRFMHKYYKQQSKFLLNKNQKKVLMILYYHGEMYMSRLGECIDLQKGSLTTLIDSLEKDGYIKRQQQSNDKRKTMLALTKKAHALIKSRQKKMKEYITHVFKNISTSDIEDLVRSFKKISSIMKQL